MSRTANVLLLVAIAALGCMSTNAQTLADLADSQRAKQAAEITRAKTELAAAEAEAEGKVAGAPKAVSDPAAAKAAAKAAAEAARPRVVLHALYSRNGSWIAELAQAQELSLALVGMQVDGVRIQSIGPKGIAALKPCSAADVREGARCGQRLIRVGETF